MFTRPALDRPFETVENLPSPVNTPDWDMPAYVSNDQLVMLTMAQEKDSRRIFLVTRDRASLPFSTAIPLDIPLGPATDSTENGAFMLSGDRRSVYFCSRSMPGGHGSTDIWVSRRVQKTSGAQATATPSSVTAATEIAIGERLTSPDYVWTKPENLGSGVNTNFFDEHPSMESDHLTMWFSGGGAIWFATRGSTDVPFTGRTQAGRVINDGRSWDSSPGISSNGLELAFQSGRGSPGGNANIDLFLARRATITSPFETPVRMPPGVNSEQSEGGPDFSADGLTLLFDSRRPGGFGNLDLYQTVRPDLNSEFGPPVSLGSLINSRSDDRSPCLSSDGTALLFDSDRQDGSGSYDIYLATRPTPDASFGPPVSLGSMVNSADPEAAPCLSRDGQTLYFVSLGRPGGVGKSDIWVSRRVPK
jgi:hypothetical protein